MNLYIAKPQLLYILLLIIPAVIYVARKYRILIKTMTDHNTVQKDTSDFGRIRKRFFFRTLFRILSWTMIVFAVAGVSWGVNTVPVQKSGRAVSLVFDISYSMEARDTYNSDTRLENAVAYAQRLLEKLPGTSVSVVLVKGDATVAIPLTEDRDAVNILLGQITPELMTAEGSSLGSGIRAAINSFPVQSAETSYIWLFTDGEETDDAFIPALNEAVKYGIPVAIIGFGTSNFETEIVAGDGITKVNTALREAAVLEAIETVQRRNNSGKVNYSIPSVSYVNAAEVGSAYKLLKLMNVDASRSDSYMDEQNLSETTNIAFEVQNIDRKNIFIILGALFLVLSFLAGELDLAPRKRNVSKVTAALLCSTMFLTGCTERMKDGKKILEGNLEWNRKNYQDAVANFLDAAETALERGDMECRDYAIYGLASTYLMQGETDAAIERFSQISADAPDSVKFAVYYNSGIIAHRRGDYNAAAEYFKEALSVDSTNTNAKVNLELSLQEDTIQATTQEQQMDSVSQSADDQGYENVIYSMIRENEQNQWKNKQQETERSSRDY